MPKDNSERIIDWPYSPTKSRSGTVSGGGGGGGGGSSTLDGLTDVTLTAPSNGQVLTYNSGTGQWVNSSAGIYTAGEAIAISGLNVISVLRNGAGAVGVIGGGLSVNVGNGIQIVSNALALNLASIPGLEYGTGSDAGKVQVQITDGIQRTGAGIGVKLKGVSGLEVDNTGVALADAIAGNGLIIAGKVLAVGAGDGIDSNADDIAVDVTDFIDTLAGLQEDASNNIQIKLATNSGLQFAGTGGLRMGVPTTLDVGSTSAVSLATHSHAITSSSDVGTTPAQSILASNGGGALTLAQLTLVGNLIFTGGSRSITASNSLTISPTTDLILDPGGLVLAPNAQDIRTVTINDLPTGIDGFRIWNRYANYTQLTIGAIKADELYVRVFVADETRIDRGEEYWSKSFGIVQTDFTMPAIGSTADVWFEDAPAAVTFNLFANGDYLLMRTIDWGTGLVVQKVWWQVTAAKLAQETTAVNGVDRQQWRIRRLAGGIDGSLIKRGNMMLDTGVVGQGWVHLSALSQDGGPFIQVGAMTSVSTVPQFTNYVRMGNLNGTVDYATNVYGMAAGSGPSGAGIGVAPSGGFSGFTIDATVGLRLFNTEIQIYNATTLELVISKTYGIRMLEADTAVVANRKYIGWFTNPVDATLNSMTGHLTSASVTGSGAHFVRLVKNAHNTLSDANGIILLLQTNSPTSTTATGPNLQINRAADGTNNVALTGGLDIIFLTATTTTVSGRLGVGTPSPQALVHMGSAAGADTLLIGGNAAFYSQISISLSAASNGYGSIQFDSQRGSIVGGPLAINPNGGNVGIGPTAPQALLHVAKSAGAETMLIGGYGNFYSQISIALSAASNGYGLIQFDSQRGSVVGGPLAINPNGGNVGINTASPAMPLHVHLATNRNLGAVNQSGNVRWTAFNDANSAAVPLYVDGSELWLQAFGGAVGIGTTTPTATESFSRFTVSGSDATALYGAIINTGAGQVGFALNRTGTTPSRWVAYVPGGADKLTFYSGTFGAVLTLTKDGYAGFNTATPEVVTSSFNMTPAAGYTAATVVGTHARLMAKGATGGGLILVADANSVNQRWLQMVNSGNVTDFATVNDAGSAIVQRFMQLDHSTGQVRVGSDSTALVGSASGLQVGANDKHIIRATLYGTAAFTLVGARAAGTPAAPAALGTGNVIMAIGALGYTSGGWSTVVNGEIDFRATEDYNGGVTSKGGAEILFYTRMNGATGVFEAMRLYQNGIVGATGVRDFNMGATGVAVFVRSDGLLGVQSSSLRFKQDIRPIPQQLDDAFVMAMEPVIYKSKPPVVDGVVMPEDDGDYIGFLAEQIEEAGGQLFVGYDKEGLPESLRYDLLTVPLVAALQGLIPYKARVEELEREVAALKRRLH